METWKPAFGFETLYEVSDHGNVRRIARSKIVDAAKVPEAKQMFEQGATLKEVAAFLGVSIPTAHSIKLGKTWGGDAGFRPVKNRTDRHQYQYVDLVDNAAYSRKRVHRLVWETFNGPIPGRLEVNHKDLNRANNHLQNLELLTHRENIQHAFNIYTQEQINQPKTGRGSPRGRYFKHDQ